MQDVGISSKLTKYQQPWPTQQAGAASNTQDPSSHYVGRLGLAQKWSVCCRLDSLAGISLLVSGATTHKHMTISRRRPPTTFQAHQMRGIYPDTVWVDASMIGIQPQGLIPTLWLVSQWLWVVPAATHKHTTTSHHRCPTRFQVLFMHGIHPYTMRVDAAMLGNGPQGSIPTLWLVSEWLRVVPATQEHTTISRHGRSTRFKVLVMHGIHPYTKWMDAAMPGIGPQGSIPTLWLVSGWLCVV